MTVFWLNAIEVGEIATLAHQQAQRCALSGEFASHMVAHKAGRACDKYLHPLISVLEMS
jgi:hypothetical protein